jgi:type II secretory pathway pseudopilin PulG
MKLPPKTGQRIAGPAIVALVLIGAGAAAVAVTNQLLTAAQAEQQAVRAARAAEQNKLAQATDEQREIQERLVDYQKLVARGVVGEERRLDWVDHINAIKAARKLPEVKYSLGPQQPAEYPGITRGGEVELLASPMQLDMGLLHEEDLFRFIGDLRGALSALVVVRSCSVERTGEAAKARGLAPRLRARCELDLVTIRDKRVGKV